MCCNLNVAFLICCCYLDEKMADPDQPFCHHVDVLSIAAGVVGIKLHAALTVCAAALLDYCRPQCLNVKRPMMMMMQKN